MRIGTKHTKESKDKTGASMKRHYANGGVHPRGMLGKVGHGVKGVNLGSKNGQWKGSAVGYHALHDWVKRRIPKPDICQCCMERPPQDVANISQEYKRDLKDWEWLCRRCHMNKDGRIKNLKQFKK